MTVKTKIQKWGNSLALRIPRPLADELGLERDSLVDLTMTKKTLVVAPAPKALPRLEDLLARVTSGNLHGEADFGSPAGREAW
jgi:antitoxin MazE